MSEEYQALSQLNERNQAIARLLIKAAKETYTMVRSAESKSKAVRDAIATRDKFTMWNVLQEYLHKYAAFINQTACITGLCVCRFGPGFYDSITETDLESQLQAVIGYIYAKEALDSVAKETYKACLKSLIKKSGLLTEQEQKFLSRL